MDCVQLEEQFWGGLESSIDEPVGIVYEELKVVRCAKNQNSFIVIFTTVR